MHKILIVEDEPTPGRVLKRLLGSAGYDVRVATDVDTAIQVAAEFKPDLLLADWLLRDKTGVEVARAARVHTPDVRVLFITGLPPDIIADEARTIAHSRILEKPLDVDTLLAAISDILNHHGAVGKPAGLPDAERA
jgi:DNA-binding response OmpR family regulator